MTKKKAKLASEIYIRKTKNISKINNIINLLYLRSMAAGCYLKIYLFQF
jgi:hypothetical protein